MKTNSKNLSLEYLNKLKDSIFRISHAVHDINNIHDLYKKIHSEITSLVHTNNFYIALLDEQNNSISFPYYVDINDPIPKESIELGTGLTSLILKSKKSCLINKKEYLQLVKNGFISRLGTAPESFLGVPLILHDKKAIGILAIQSYTKEIIFNQITTGAQNDLEKATELARKMVCEWGMSEKMGLLHMVQKKNRCF